MAQRIRIGINGFGRIGRVVFRAGFFDERFEFVGINTLDSAEGIAHLLKFDSSHGIFSPDVRTEGNSLIVNDRKIPLFKVKNPAEIPWASQNIDIVFECTGAFKAREEFAWHLKAGAKRVMVSAPADGVDHTFVFGVNHLDYDPKNHFVISNASCTTNCLAPIAKVIHEHFGITSGTMLTVHSYTNDQRILDAPHKDLRRARAAAVSMIPTTTGAAKAVGLVLPALKGKLDGIAIRVPTPNVSLVDFTFVTEKEITKETVNQALRSAAYGSLKGILGFEERELVSIDFNGNPLSSIVDAPSTMVLGNRMGKVLSWYDNETGFSHRMLDLAYYMFQKGI
ncbi:MAG: type I glyceraldehyde-3-phosphate dehydrogenase [Pseudobdellovibrionaceae bacterium]|nr:type I glyceraldehyde-3-phosphate dehydrogenase [Pseudobdellovibrionaceae bacterium]